MRGLMALLIFGLALAGCVAPPGNEIDPRGGGPAVSAGNGVILFGVASTREAPPVHWAIDIRRLDRSGRPEPARFDAGTANAIVFNQFTGTYDRNAPFGAYSVLPGDYAIIRITAQQDGGMFTDFDHGAAAMQAAAMGPMGMLSYAILGTAAASERAAEEARFGPRVRSPLIFVPDGGVATSETPRFTVRAGEVIYLGDFLFGATRYHDQRIEPGSGGATSIRAIVSPFVETAVDPAAAHAAQTRIGLASWPLRTAQPSALAGGPVYLAPSMTRDRVDWLSAGTVVREETVHARSPAPGPAAARVPPQGALDRSTLSKQELQRRFLAGEITAEQYRAAVADP